MTTDQLAEAISRTIAGRDDASTRIAEAIRAAVSYYPEATIRSIVEHLTENDL